MSIMPWAAHMAKNWKSMSEIGLRHPTIYFVVLIYLYTEPTGVVYWASRIRMWKSVWKEVSTNIYMPFGFDYGSDLNLNLKIPG